MDVMLQQVVLAFFCAVGIAWTVWRVFLFLWKTMSGFRTYVWPHLTKRKINLVAKYGSWAVITGSTDGIGLAYAKELAKRNVNIVLISRTLEKLEKVAAAIEQEYAVETKIIVADFAEGKSVYERVKQELKDIQVGILVNNVGIFVPYPMRFQEFSDQLMWDTVNINCGATLAMTKMLLPQMQQRRRGAIVNVSSITEMQCGPFISMYAASKAFINRFSEAIRFENRKYGITVQVLMPSFVRTSIVADFSQTKAMNMAPGAAQYARHAISTLGIADHTAGYWAYGLMSELNELYPMWLRTYICSLVMRTIRKDYFADRLKKPSSQ